MTTDQPGSSTEDEHVDQLLVEELAALTRVLFGVSGANEVPAEPSHQPAEHSPAQLTPSPGPPQAIQLTAALDLPVATEPDEAATAAPASSYAPTAIPLPAIPLPAVALTAEPLLPDEMLTASHQPGGQRLDAESLDLLAEIAFLDE